MKCPYYEISREQRETEQKRGLSNLGTKGYEIQGCYKCSGINLECEVYKNIMEEEKE